MSYKDSKQILEFKTHSKHQITFQAPTGFKTNFSSKVRRSKKAYLFIFYLFKQHLLFGVARRHYMHIKILYIYIYICINWAQGPLGSRRGGVQILASSSITSPLQLSARSYVLERNKWIFVAKLISLNEKRYIFELQNCIFKLINTFSFRK